MNFFVGLKKKRVVEWGKGENRGNLIPPFTVRVNPHKMNGRNAFRRSSDLNPFMPTGAFNICCPRDCVSRHNGGTSGAPLNPFRVDSALRALSSLGGLRGAPEVLPLCRETQSLGQQMLNAPVGINGISKVHFMY